MKIEKIYAILFVIVFALAIAPFAFAEEDVLVADSLITAQEVVEAESLEDLAPINDVDPSMEETPIAEEEVTIMGNQFGYELRYLQLEKAIINAREGQKEVIDYISEQDSEVDVSELEAISYKLVILLEELQSINTTVDSESNIESYVAIRDQAKEVIKLFRETAHELLDEGELLQLRSRVRNLNRNRVNDLDKRINATKQKYNSEMVKELFGRVGITDKPLIDAVESGEANYGQIRSAVANTFRNLTKEAKEDAILRAREAKAKYEVQKQALMKKLQAGTMEAARNRINTKLQLSSRNGSNNADVDPKGGNQ